MLTALALAAALSTSPEGAAIPDGLPDGVVSILCLGGE
jgi:hypothetical protein